MSGLARRGLQLWRGEGFLGFIQITIKWVLTRYLLLIREPVEKLSPISCRDNFSDGRVRIAVQVHVFYIELVDEMILYTNHIPYAFDCFVSTDTPEKAEIIRFALGKRSAARSWYVNVYPNRGRDVAPFLVQMSPHILEYDYICHLHTKHSGHRGFGEKWRRQLLESLLASPGYTAALLERMEQDKKLGIVFQQTFWRVKPSLGWKGNRHKSEELLKVLGVNVRLPNMPQFPAGDMFWARTIALLPAFEHNWHVEDFPVEACQIEGTLAHCFERCWAIIAQADGYIFARVEPAPKGQSKRLTYLRRD